MASFIKNLRDSLVAIPNLPALIIIFVYVFVRTLRETGAAEMVLNQEDNIDKIGNSIKTVYPRHLCYTVAIIFYLWSIIYLIH